MMLARVKKHRWHQKILKSSDPLIFSIGWRRFQSLPLYCTKDENLRMRFLKYTPEHMHCLMAFYGPATPPNTGFLAYQQAEKKSFRISTTGVSCWKVAANSGVASTVAPCSFHGIAKFTSTCGWASSIFTTSREPRSDAMKRAVAPSFVVRFTSILGISRRSLTISSCPCCAPT